MSLEVLKFILKHKVVEHIILFVFCKADMINVYEKIATHSFNIDLRENYLMNERLTSLILLYDILENLKGLS